MGTQVDPAMPMVGKRRAQKARKLLNDLNKDGANSANVFMATTYKLVDSPKNYSMVDATVRNHKVKHMVDGKVVSDPVPTDNMVIKREITGKDGKVTVVERPRYTRLIAIPFVDRTPKTRADLHKAIDDLYDLIENYDTCDRVEAPDLPDGGKPANVKRVATIASKPGGRDPMDLPEYLWSALNGAIRLDTQQNGQSVMRKRIESEIYAELGWIEPTKRVRGTKVEAPSTADRFAGMAGKDE